MQAIMLYCVLATRNNKNKTETICTYSQYLQLLITSTYIFVESNINTLYIPINQISTIINNNSFVKY